LLDGIPTEDRDQAAFGTAGRGIAEGLSVQRVDTPVASTRNDSVRGTAIHFFGDAGTEAGCGIDDAHREWHRNRLLFLQIYYMTLLQGAPRPLTQINVGHATNTVIIKRPRSAPMRGRCAWNGSTAANRLVCSWSRTEGHLSKHRSFPLLVVVVWNARWDLPGRGPHLLHR
jgi:hypothetical protein